MQITNFQQSVFAVYFIKEEAAAAMIVKALAKSQGKVKITEYMHDKEHEALFIKAERKPGESYRDFNIRFSDATGIVMFTPHKHYPHWCTGVPIVVGEQHKEVDEAKAATPPSLMNRIIKFLFN